MIRNHTIAALAIAALTSPAFSQQGPDILIPSGNNDGAFALVDLNKDGKYAGPMECWDYFMYDVNTSPKWFLPLNGRLYFCDTLLDKIVSIDDTNKNGLIEPSERVVFFDFVAAFSGGQAPRMIDVDSNGWLWSTNTEGTAEGIYRHKDLNADGDAEDTGETIAVLTENMPNVAVANTPNTSGNPPVPPVLSLTSVDHIVYDGGYKQGRFIIEDEASDQTIALEDKNGDGDFNDTGEVYLFCALWNSGTIGLDLNPDVTSGALPICNEIRSISPDLFGNYYMLSADTNSGNSDAAIILRGKDANGDGDVNDAGETTIFWDGSLDSTGATNTYNFCYGMSLDLAGRLYVTAELDGSPDHEQLILISDKNNDGDANDPGETEVLWDYPVDRTHYRPAILPPNTLATLVGKTTLAEAEYYGGATCVTSLSATALHNIQYGFASSTSGGSSKPPIIGNPNWTLRTWGARPSAPGGYAIGLTQFVAGIPLDAAGTCRIYNSVDILGLPFTTDAAGAQNTVVAIPNDPTLLGVQAYFQSYVRDATAPSGLGVTFSDGLAIKVGDYSYTK